MLLWRVDLDCRPAKWLWGLPPLIVITALALFGVQEQVERDLRDRTTATLKEKGLSWAIAKFDGRDAFLEGLSFSRPERDQALQTIQNVWGVRTVVDRSHLIASPETYTWTAIREERRIKIRGHVPTENDRRTILGFIKAAMPDLEVDDKMTLAGGSPPRQTWLGSVSFALVQLGQLNSGSVRLAGTNLIVSGEAKTTAAYRFIKSSLSTQLPEGTQIQEHNISPPVVSPYSWRVKYTGSAVSMGGYVPSEDVHAQILERTRNLFPGKTVEDTMELASGAPNGWLWAVSASLTQLHRLQSGRVKLKDTVLEFQGVALNKGTAKDVTASIRHSLPATYRSSEEITVQENAGPSKSPVN
jgi:hypothetical protein